jgi:altronate dehydratase
MPELPDLVILVLDPRDNVAVAIRPLETGRLLDTADAAVKVSASIPTGHKVALRAIAVDEDVIKYGEPIGHATVPIAAGEHVHTHNLVGNRLGVPQ